LISERSIEENIVKKANQKRLLGDLAIEGGNFTTAFFKKSTIKDLFDTNTETNETIAEVTELPDEETTNSLETISKKATKAFEKAIATVEDNTDLIVRCLFIFSCSPNPTTNFETTNIHFSRLFYLVDCL
jgi:E1A-binding protein p400